MTEPLLPDFVDLSDFSFMPLRIDRLKRSKQWLIAKRRPEIGFYSVNLWTRAWHERPAGSIEDDDDVLADAAMCSPERWHEVRDDVLRGWVKCSDGRLYHHAVCEEAAKSWNEKASHRWRRECDRTRKENVKRKEKGEPERALPPEPPKVSAGATTEFRAPSSGIPAEENGIPAENALKGQGQGQGQGQYPSSSARAGANEKNGLEVECRAMVGGEPVLLAQDFHTLESLLVDGNVTEADIKTGISAAMAEPNFRISHWSQLAGWARRAAKERLGTAAKKATGPPGASGEQPYSHRAAIEGAKAILREKAKAAAQ